MEIKKKLTLYIWVLNFYNIYNKYQYNIFNNIYIYQYNISPFKKTYLNKIQINKMGTKLKQINIYGY